MWVTNPFIRFMFMQSLCGSDRRYLNSPRAMRVVAGADIVAPADESVGFSASPCSTGERPGTTSLRAGDFPSGGF